VANPIATLRGRRKKRERDGLGSSGKQRGPQADGRNPPARGAALNKPQKKSQVSQIEETKGRLARLRKKRSTNP